MVALAPDFLHHAEIDETRAELAAARADLAAYGGALARITEPAYRAKVVLQIAACERWIGYYQARLRDLGVGA